MAIDTIFRETSWLKQHVALAIAAIGSVLTILLWVRFVVVRKRDVTKLLEQTYVKYTAPKRKSVRPIVFLAALTAISLSLTSIAAGYALCAYILLDNWDEGNHLDLIGDHVGALLCYQRALRVGPHLGKTHLYCGRALLESAKISAAVPHLALAEKYLPEDHTPPGLLGDCYQLLGKPNLAAAEYQRAARIAPDMAMYWTGIGSCMQKLDRFTAAYAAYTHSLRIEPNNVDTLLKIGALLIQNGPREECLAYLSRAVTLNPANPLAHNLYATANARFGIQDKAEEEHKRALQLNPTLAVLYYDYGITLERDGQLRRAMAEFRQCMLVHPRTRVDKTFVDRASLKVDELRKQSGEE